MPELSVFISYRRADTSADAGRLYDALRRRFGRENLFMDVDSLRPGQDWVNVVEAEVGRCDVLLALIGPDWLNAADRVGERRLDNELDRVRLEIEAALVADKPVIPVLFENASMPRSDELPSSLRPLVRRHAIRISHATFESDLRVLVRALRTIERAKEGHEVAAPARAMPPTAPPGQAPVRPAITRPPTPPPPPTRTASSQPQPPPQPQPHPMPLPAAPQPAAGRPNRNLIAGALIALGLLTLLIIGAVWLLGSNPTPSPTPSASPTAAPPTATPTAGPTATTNSPVLPPAGTATVVGTGEAGLTTTPSVTVRVAPTGPAGSITRVRVANSGATSGSLLSDVGAQTLTYAPELAWQLSPGDGEKTVFVQWAGAADNWTAPISVTIFLDSPPIAEDDHFETNNACSEHGYMLFPVFENDVDPAGGRRFADNAPFLTQAIGASENGHGTVNPVPVLEGGKYNIRYDCITISDFSDAFEYTIYDASDSTSTARVTFNVPPLP